nr:DUF4386 domain-containing protein [Gracilibacillus saliphilus]
MVNSISQRNAALTAGISLIIMTIAAFFSSGFVYESLIVQGDAGTTFHNINNSQILYTAGVFGWLIILITDILVAWGFYIFLKPLNNILSLLGAWLRLMYTAILAIAVFNLIMVMLLTNSADYESLFHIDQLQGKVMLFLDAFHMIWSMGLVIFGGHLLVVGYITFKSDNIPKFISILLLIASVGYIVNHLLITFLPQYQSVIMVLELVFLLPMIVGELGFGIWLLIKTKIKV